MNDSQFIEIFKDIIQSDAALDMSWNLKDIEEWDSMAVMATIAYFDVKFGVTLVFDDFQHMRTVRDLAQHVPSLNA